MPYRRKPPPPCKALDEDAAARGQAKDASKSDDDGLVRGDESAGMQAGNMGNRFASVRKRKEMAAKNAVATEAKISESMRDVDSKTVVGLSVAFYGAMTAAAIALGGTGVYNDLLQGWDVPAGLGCLVPFILGLLAGVKYSDSIPALAQMRDSYKSVLVPLLSGIPTWGHCVMALGAAVGEEALFRAFMQTSVLAMLPVDGATSVGASVAITSLVFGLLHTLSPASFAWATAGSVIFGYEYHYFGLGAAVITHWLYDWFAFYYICRIWGSEGSADTEKA